jgi:ribokinase
MHALGHGVPLDALVWSADDETEREEAARARADARLAVVTEGERGGSYQERGGPGAEHGGSDTERVDSGAGRADPDTPRGESGRWPAAEPPGAPVDSYGCGDSFAAGLTFGLGRGLPAPDAIELAARCGATCLTGRGPYERQLTCIEN